jgi:hypothetical protein
MSSQIFPHLENPLVAPEDRYDLSFARGTLSEVGELARKYSHRLTFHPSHFNQLGAVEGKVLDGTFADLKMHADILDAMGCDQVSGKDGLALSFAFELLRVCLQMRQVDTTVGACQVNEKELFGLLFPFRCLSFCLPEEARRRSAYMRSGTTRRARRSSFMAFFSLSFLLPASPPSLF